MREIINEEVGVLMYYSSKTRTASPYLIDWHGKSFKVGEIGYHHKVKEGVIIHHIFELTDREKSTWFRLNFNTDNLHWKLEVVSDGLAN